jgi:hypothetical protein
MLAPPWGPASFLFRGILMMTQAKPKTYKVAVYYRDADGIWHYHATWHGEANSPADAKYRAIDLLSTPQIEKWKAEIIPSRHRN